MPNQTLNVAIAIYWKGAAGLSGSQRGKPLREKGSVELISYSDRLERILAKRWQKQEGRQNAAESTTKPTHQQQFWSGSNEDALSSLIPDFAITPKGN
ncbi:MAG: hypothetical protein MUF72_06130 [Elainella sp. Prado103]|nr:hypothetical protein [Elainella sp. Prado103]